MVELASLSVLFEVRERQCLYLCSRASMAHGYAISHLNRPWPGKVRSSKPAGPGVDVLASYSREVYILRLCYLQSCAL